MLCRHPFIKEGFPYPCGQCMPCRLMKRRHWTHRIMLEAGLYQFNAFITLTYDDENMPRLKDGRGNLVPDDLKNFLKRLREHLRAEDPEYRIRFFGVGEYGGQTERPHYHVALFNYRPCWRLSGSMFKELPYKEGLTCCPQCDLIYKKWGKGHVHSGRITVRSSAYIASYTTKKMTKADDARLNGRHPEFARQSNRPGIGADAMHEVASTILQFDLEKMIDVPNTLRHGGKEWPLASYLRRKLRRLIGRDEKTPDEVLELLLEELRPVQEAAQALTDELGPHNTQMYGQIYRQLLLKKEGAKADQVENRERIFKKRERL